MGGGADHSTPPPPALRTYHAESAGGGTPQDKSTDSGALLPHRYLVSDGDQQYFRVLPLAQMSSGAIAQVLTSRAAYKRSVFASAITQLSADPTLADLPGCSNIQSAISGTCVVHQPQVNSASMDSSVISVANAAVPQINRKTALVIGVNRYDDKRIPQLVGALPDAQAVGQTFADALGYRVVRLNNPTKSQLIAALNNLVTDAQESDSLVVYFAGHGELVESTGHGYWIPSDGDASNPRSWISNADINRVLSAARSRQIAVVADSCYSGAFAKEMSLSGQQRRQLDGYLNQRAVVIMSSGGDEPVADTAKNGHSVFAWNFMEKLRDLGDWTPGASLFTEVRTAVERELPQTPMYGASLSAGHQDGGDYLFERRRISR